MDFVDWRKVPDTPESADRVPTHEKKRRGKRFTDYIEEQICEAEERGEFANLPGIGKPLKLVENVAAGDNAMAYNLLQSNGFAPPEIELLKEIDLERERTEAKVAKCVRQYKTLRMRRLPPFVSEKRAFNATVEQTLVAYEQALRKINSKILTLNISAPASLHRPMVDIEEQLRNFRLLCPLFIL